MGVCVDQDHLEAILKLKQKQYASLGSELEKWADCRPGHPAIIYEGRTISYADFNKMANRYAHFFTNIGLNRGDVVALMMGNCPEFLAIVAGLSKVGIIASLINIELRGEVLAYGINLCEARAVVLEAGLLDLFASIKDRIRLKTPGLILVETEKALSPGQEYKNLTFLISASPDNNPFTTKAINSEDTLAYLFTSGSKGRRKAAPLLQKRWLAIGHQVNLNCQMNQATIQYMCLPLYLNSGFTFCFSAMLVSGSTMVLRRAFSLHHFWDDIRQHGATFFTGVGEIYRYLLTQPESVRDADNPLQTAVSNGIQSEFIEMFRRRFCVTHMMEMYGTTENVGIFINHQEIPGMIGNLTLNGLRQGEVVLCGAQDGLLERDEAGQVKKCQPGETGLLLCEINELNPFPGYIGDPDATSDKLARDVFRPGDAYLNTGDLMRLQEQDFISFVDRLGDTYRWKGKTVSSDSVADVIKKFYGGIEDVVVYGVKIPGMEGRCGMAAIRLMHDSVLDWKAFALYINNRMPDYARPIFIRVCQHLGLDGPLRDFKSHLQLEEYNLLLVNDELFYYDLNSENYLPLSSEVFLAIIKQDMPL